MSGESGESGCGGGDGVHGGRLRRRGSVRRGWRGEAHSLEREDGRV